MDPDKLSLKSYGAGLQPPSFKRLNIHNILNRIISLNHAWKIAREDFGARNNITTALRRQKASWQARYCFEKEKNSHTGQRLLLARA